MILITGATGQLGRAVIDALIQQQQVAPSKIVAIARNADKAQSLVQLGVQVRIADYSRAEGWDQALAGAERVLLISSSEIGQRVQQHRNVIEAAKRAQIKLLAYTSVLHADKSGLGLATEHRATEQAIQESGLNFVLLRNGWYIENYTMGIPAALAHGAVIGCAGEGRISAAARKDYAAAAAVVLTSEKHDGKIYELAGNNAFTMAEFAATLSSKAGKTIPYVNLPANDYQQALINAGLPEPFAALLADADTGIAKGDLFDDGQQLSQLIGRASTPMEEVVAQAF